MRWIAAALLLASPVLATATDLREVIVDRKDGVYTLHSVVLFDSNLRQIYDTFSDWDQSTKFSSVVVEARDIPPDESGRQGFYIRNRACIAFFCKSFERAGYVDSEPYVWLRASADPERSDFHISNESWQFVQTDEGVIVTYDLEFQPKFWVPPLIGPYVIKRKLRTDAPEALIRIDQVAREQE